MRMLVNHFLINVDHMLTLITLKKRQEKSSLWFANKHKFSERFNKKKLLHFCSSFFTFITFKKQRVKIRGDGKRCYCHSLMHMRDIKYKHELPMI